MTILNWLNCLERLEWRPFEEVIVDADRPAGPTYLADDEYDQLRSILDKSPGMVRAEALH